MCAAGPEQMLADATFAVAHEPPWSLWRDEAVGLLAEALLVTGDVEQGAAAFAETSALAATQPTRTRARSARPSSPCWRSTAGRWAEAAERVELALAAIDKYRMHDYAISALAFAVAARVAVHRGDLKEANRLVAVAMRARPTLTFVLPIFAVRARLQLAKACWAIGDQSAARHLLREIDDILVHRPALGTLVDEVAEFREQVIVDIADGSDRASPLSPARSCGCSPTCRRTSPSARSPSGSSCLATRSAPRSARSTGSSACPPAAKRCNRRRRSACSAGDAGLTPRAGARRPRRCRSRAPARASVPRPRRTGARRRPRR